MYFTVKSGPEEPENDEQTSIIFSFPLNFQTYLTIRKRIRKTAVLQ